jgi:WD40 repeat protein
MGRWGILAGTLVLASAAGCSDDVKGHLDDLKNGHHGQAGAGGAAGGCPPGMAGSGGGGAGGGGMPGTCANLTFASTFVSAPAAEGQLYKRCETIGVDNDWHVTLSADGSKLAARTSSGTVRMIDTRSWREVAHLASPLGGMNAAEFSPDVRTLATLSSEMGGVTLWNANNGALDRGLAGPPAGMIGRFADDLAFSADQGRLATSLETVMNLMTGASTLWANGMTTTFNLLVNPETTLTEAQNIGQSFHDIRFLPDDNRLYVRREFQVGNSPPTTNVSLIDPSTGAAIQLLSVFTNDSSAAISNDRQRVATANLNDAEPPIGLVVYRTDTGAMVAIDPALTTVRVLGFSPDGARLYVRGSDGATVMVLDAADLHLVSSFSIPASELFLGISPFDAVVTSNATQSVWWDTTNGAVLRVAPYPLTEVTWSAEGQFGAGTNGGQDALFHFWREPGGTEHCAPPPRLGSTPPLASFGGPSSADGSVVTTQQFVIHTAATDWTALNVRDASGNLLRLFSPSSSDRGVAVSADGSRLYTNEGTAVAVWCR